MTAELRKVIIREGPIFAGFIALFLIGFTLSRTVFNSLVAQILILIGLYGYPAFVIISYTTQTLKAFKSLDAANQRKKITIIILSVVALYLAIFMHNYVRTKFSVEQSVEKETLRNDEANAIFFANPAGLATNSSCTITAKILSVEEKYYDDLTITKRKHLQQGVTKVFLQLQILGVEGISPKKPVSATQLRICEVGQIVDVFAYKETDYVGTQPLRKFDRIKCEIMTVPDSSGGYYYKIERIRRL